jgi:hypothetical protein
MFPRTTNPSLAAMRVNNPDCSRIFEFNSNHGWSRSS